MMGQGFLYMEFNIRSTDQRNDHAMGSRKRFILINLLNDAGNAAGINPDRIIAGKAQLNGNICSVALSRFRQGTEKQYLDLFQIGQQSLLIQQTDKGLSRPPGPSV